MKTKLTFILGLLASALSLHSSRADCVSAPSGLIAWWRAENSALDQVSTNHGTLLNGATFAPGLVGQAFSFDGNANFIQVADSESLRPAAGVSLEVWIHTTGTADFSGIISKMQHGGPIHLGWKMDMDTAGRARADFGNGSGIGNDYLSVTHPAVVTNGNWHHLVATYDGAVAFFYVDGTPGPPESGTGFLAANTRTLIIGNDDCCAGRFFHGEIDEASIYNRALSAAEVQALFNAGSAGKCTTPALAIFRSSTNTAVVSWPSPSTGFGLQQNTNSLSSVNWSNVTAITDNGTNKFMIVDPPIGNRFYRLFKP